MRNDRRTGRLVAAVVLGAALLAPGVGRADDEGPNRGLISLSVTNDFTNTYMFRGIQQERDGFIWQPYGEVNINAYSDEGEDAILTGITPFVGSWNSVHSENTLSSGSGPDNWYESDVYLGAKFTMFGPGKN